MDNILSAEQESLLKRTRDTLGDLRDALAEAGAPQSDRAALADSIKQLDELFLLVIVGEFNAGKSSFINALLGQQLLAEGVTPTTAHIYLLKYGEQIAQTPGEKGVWVQTAPVDFLSRISIVDTPGTNAIVREHEALTNEFVPRSDLVLFLTSADRPFTESERSFLERIRDWGKKIVLVINKIDIVDTEEDKAKIVGFVRQSAATLLGDDDPTIFAVSARKAQMAKSGEPKYWDGSGFEEVEMYVHQILDDDGRFRLKLLNPLGVGMKLTRQQLQTIEADLGGLSEDSQLLEDIESQMKFYQDDMDRNFKARLGEIENLLYEMEKRGIDFLDETMRLARIPDLMRSEQIKESFETKVVGTIGQDIESRVGELIDWMVEQDLRQWTAVAEHLSKRRKETSNRVVGQSGPKEGTLAYDRQRLVDSLTKSTRQVVESYDRSKESAQLAAAARQGVVQTGIAGVGMGIGVAVAAAASVAWIDVTGIVAGGAALLLGLFILPRQRRKAKEELSAKLSDLRQRLVDSLTYQFDREMRRGNQRIEDTVAPFGRFVRSQQERIEEQQETFGELEAHLIGLQRHLAVEE
ncbi:MAG TPA: dynamin family protein [Anaerolineae bacterium]|nr:dynamin family protein [Anaerolineae bacterium]